ncbi:hypothetical protein [Planctomonas deserti]|uniref:hypothetical protein n=1 Tax=Planctomonas deserti TaxID=2144185 RepID=UPI000D35E019|nr:hypothetical protein [Planctomonas deserti]
MKTDLQRRQLAWYPPTCCAAVGWGSVTGGVVTIVLWATWFSGFSSIDGAMFLLLLSLVGSLIGMVVGLLAVTVATAIRAIVRRWAANRAVQAAAGAIALLFSALAGGVIVLLPFASDGAGVAHGVVVFMSLLGAVGYYLRVTERIPWWSRPIADLDRPPR